MTDERTLLKASLSIVDSETLQTILVLSYGIIDNPRQLEKLRVKFQEANPDYIILGNYTEILNPEYSPLKSFPDGEIIP